MRLDDRVDDILSLVVTETCKVVSDVGDMITTRVVGFSSVHRVMGAVG